MDPKNWTPLIDVEYRIRKKVQDAKGTQDLYCRVQNNVELELIAGKKTEMSWTVTQYLQLSQSTPESRTVGSSRK